MWEYHNSGCCDAVYAKDSLGADRRICEMIGPDGPANARLVAAAPELLAACRAMQQVLRSGPTTGKDLSYELGLAHAAIAKATR